VRLQPLGHLSRDNICCSLRLGGKLMQGSLNQRPSAPPIKFPLILWSGPPKPQGTDEIPWQNFHPEPSRPDGRQYFSRNSWQACESDAEVVRRAITDPFVGAFLPAFEHGSGLGGQVFGGSPLVRSDGLDPAAESAHAIPNRAEPRPLQSIGAVYGESRKPSQAEEESQEEREIGGCDRRTEPDEPECGRHCCR
jgi:hypothetical protein